MIRRMRSIHPRPGEPKALKELLLDELILRLNETQEAPLPNTSMTNARLLVRSIVDRSIAKGDFKGMKYLTDLVGLGERADVRREQLRMEKSRLSEKQAVKPSEKAKEADLSRAAEVYQAVQEALKAPVKDRTLDDLMR